MKWSEDNESNRKQIEQGLDFLRGFFERKGSKISVMFDPTYQQEITYRLTGQVKELKRKPELLSSLTRLTQMALTQGCKKKLKCVLDLEGHLSMRRVLVETIAEDAADITKHTGRRAVIEGLTSYERRKVHQLLSEDKDVDTLSEGEGEFRYMMVAPKGQ